MCMFNKVRQRPAQPYRRLLASLTLIACGYTTEIYAQSANNSDIDDFVAECGANQLCFAVDAAQQSPISPYIYGTNDTAIIGSPRFTLHRFGGNRLTAYNWENNASNAGADYFHQSDGYLGGGNTPGEAARSRIADAHANGAAALTTIPIQGYVAADKNGGGDVNQTPNYLQTRFHQSIAAKGSAFALSPDLNDNAVYQDEFVNFLENQFSAAHTGDMPEVFYCMDNEPGLWNSTHERIQPNKITYAGLIDKTLTFAEAIKAAAPDAMVFGPVNYGWHGFHKLQDAPDANNRHFLETYLTQVRQRSEEIGTRLVDVLDVHWYSEAQGNGQRITLNGAGDAVMHSAPVAEARMQAPRSLWDGSYTEDSWITQYVTNGPIQLIPYLHNIIDNNYPGTKVAFTEFSHGGGNHISGAVAQADTLGIFGREGVFAATHWKVGDESFGYAAFDMYRNFDLSDRTFGDTSLAAVTSDLDDSSVYGSLDSEGLMILVVINKTSAEKSADFLLANSQAYQNAEFFHLTDSSPAPQVGASMIIGGSFQFTANLPASSVTTIVLSGEVSNDNEPPAPVEPFVLYNGETVPFSAGWAANNGNISQKSRKPFSAPNHIRAKIRVSNWWGGAGYAFYNWASGDWNPYQTLRFQARVNKPVNVTFKIQDAGETDSVGFTHYLTKNYQQIEIPLSELGAVNLSEATQFQINISVSGNKRFNVDVDEIMLIP